MRILVSARDAAAALHLIEIVREAQRCSDIDLRLVTQAPATRYFENAGIPSMSVDAGPVRSKESPDGTRLLAIAREIAAREQPDAILCGLSTPFDGGIDEAMIAV